MYFYVGDTLFISKGVLDFYKIEDMFKEMVVEGADNTQSHCPETFLKGDLSLMIRSGSEHGAGKALLSVIKQTTAKTI
jgi:hypothetical protein